MVAASTLMLVARGYALIYTQYYAWDNLIPFAFAAWSLTELIWTKIRQKKFIGKSGSYF